jgi:hypothetical protein
MNERPMNDQPMDHAAAHERIEDLLLDPTRLAALATATAPEDLALREHLAGCQACAADLDAWRRLQVAVDDALPQEADAAARAQAVEPLELPPSLRARVLAAVADTDRREANQPGTPISITRARRGYRLGQLVGLAAGLIVLTGASVIVVDQVGQRAAAEADAQELSHALAVVDRMLATDHKVVPLRTSAGLPAGTISWSRHDWVVLSNALSEPDSGRQYLCWLETDGRSVPIGEMEFAGESAYWVASLDEWQTWELGPTTRFVVTLEAVGATERTGPAVLEALLAT